MSEQKKRRIKIYQTIKQKGRHKEEGIQWAMHKLKQNGIENYT